MKSPISKKGFTLIELLIVIAIIAVLAIAFVPTLLGAPAKGRDSARIASLQNIQKSLMFGSLESIPLPDTGCVDDTLFVNLLVALGGTAPKDPSSENVVPGVAAAGNAAAVGACTGKFSYIKGPSTSYLFGLYAHVEIEKNANTKCSTALGGTIELPVEKDKPEDWCYAILAQ